MTKSLPTLRVTGGLAAALSADVLQRLDSAHLSAFLLQRRWFGGKGRAPAAVRVGDVIELRDAEARFAIARLDVEIGGRVALYQLPLAVRRDGDGEMPAALLALVESGTECGMLFDAVEDERFRGALGNAFRAGESFGGGSRWIVEPVGKEDARPNIASLESRTVRAEQSNTSIIFGEAAIMKLFRRLEPGVNPDVEIGRYLTTKAQFAHTPPLFGVIRYEGEDGVHAVAGMLQQFLPGSIDAWQYALERSRPFFRDDSAGISEQPFAADAEQLGRITRELHDVLAAPSDDESFGPRPVAPDDVARWTTSARRHIEEAMTLLAERLEAGALPNAAAARALLDRRDGFLAQLDELSGLIGEDAGELIRHHGDYHLGQVLRTRDDDFQIIDFEGEPARPLAERRERNSALRDVAGMLRSFAYAAATLAAEQRDHVNAQLLERRSADWERASRQAFLRGYLGGPRGTFLPADPQRVEALLALFEMEKLFYEMSYELNNRPEWVWIPINGATTLATRVLRATTAEG